MKRLLLPRRAFPGTNPIVIRKLTVDECIGLFSRVENAKADRFRQCHSSFLIICVSRKEQWEMDMEPSSKAKITEREIAKRIEEAGIRLRFDKVALRLLDSVKAALGLILPIDQSIAFTVTAPIKLPAKTSAALRERLRQLPTKGLSTTINGNEVRARMVKDTSRNVPRVIGFVHNPKDNADLLLEIAETCLHGR